MDRSGRGVDAPRMTNGPRAAALACVGLFALAGTAVGQPAPAVHIVLVGDSTVTPHPVATAQ